MLTLNMLTLKMKCTYSKEFRDENCRERKIDLISID